MYFSNGMLLRMIMSTINNYLGTIRMNWDCPGHTRMYVHPNYIYYRCGEGFVIIYSSWKRPDVLAYTKGWLNTNPCEGTTFWEQGPSYFCLSSIWPSVQFTFGKQVSNLRVWDQLAVKQPTSYQSHHSVIRKPYIANKWSLPPAVEDNT